MYPIICGQGGNWPLAFILILALSVQVGDRLVALAVAWCMQFA